MRSPFILLQHILPQHALTRLAGALAASEQPWVRDRLIRRFAAAYGVDTLLITGVTTSGCIRATALDTLQHGFAPFVVRDACGDRHPGPHEANLFDLQAKYAEVISEEEAIRLLEASRPV
ncbi:MAG: isochorismatase family protein [Erythrobacteraceae bacterium]